MSQRRSGYDRNDAEAYFTPFWPVDLLFEEFAIEQFETVYDPCAGAGHIMAAAERWGLQTFGTDLHRYDPKVCNAPITEADFQLVNGIPPEWGRTIICSNLPFGQQGRLARRLVKNALRIARQDGCYVAFLFNRNFDAAVGRVSIFRDCKQFLGEYVLLPRIEWANIDPSPDTGSSSDFCWYVWAPVDREADPIVGWLGTDETNTSFEVWNGERLDW